MENSEIKSMWKQAEDEIQMKSDEELRRLLEKKKRKILTKFYFQHGFSAVVSASFFIFLLITALNREGDIYYQLNNLFIGILVVFAFFSTLFSMIKFSRNKNNLPLKEWLDVQIKWISKSRNRIFVWFLLPVLAVPSILSIHVYYEREPFTKVITTEESIFGLLFGLLAGLAVAYFSVSKIRKYQKQQLELLRNLHAKLVEI